MRMRTGKIMRMRTGKIMRMRTGKIMRMRTGKIMRMRTEKFVHTRAGEKGVREMDMLLRSGSKFTRLEDDFRSLYVSESCVRVLCVS